VSKNKVKKVATKKVLEESSCYDKKKEKSFKVPRCSKQTATTSPQLTAISIKINKSHSCYLIDFLQLKKKQEKMEIPSAVVTASLFFVTFISNNN
jgi:hypothetical protein